MQKTHRKKSKQQREQKTKENTFKKLYPVFSHCNTILAEVRHNCNYHKYNAQTKPNCKTVDKMIAHNKPLISLYLLEESDPPSVP